MTINLNTTIHLFDGELNTWTDMAAATPVWSGPFSKLIDDNSDDLTWDEVAYLGNELARGNQAHLDKGAGGKHSMCTDDALKTARSWNGEPKAPTPSTADIGCAIRDALEDTHIQLTDWAGGQAEAFDEKAYIDHVDVSDPHNPVVHTGGGVFKLTITKIA